MAETVTEIRNFMHKPFLNHTRHLLIGLLIGAGFFGALSYAVFTEPTLPPPIQLFTL